MRSTCLVFGYEAVNIGSKIAARYTASIGDVKDEAITEPGWGRRACWCLDRELKDKAFCFSPAEVSYVCVAHAV